MLHKVRRTVRRFLHWVFGAPFEELPLGFGKPMPEMRAFKEEMDETQHRAHGNALTRSVRGHERARPTR
jgi:hypothetical protein